jgi:very-short-patch-repair endonuclease
MGGTAGLAGAISIAAVGLSQIIPLFTKVEEKATDVADRIKAVAERIASYKDKNTDVAVIVSAMADTTDDLIELAGKIAKNDWRHDIVKDLRWLYSDSDYVDSEPWPIAEDAIGPGVDYVGPYFITCDHGCAHGRDHAFMGGCSEDPPIHIGDTTGGHGCYLFERREYAAHRCIEAINRCDVMVAVITPDAHGTLVEVGYAHALGKEIMLVRGDATTDGWSHVLDQGGLEAWFPFALKDVWCATSVDHAIECLRIRGRRVSGASLCESPIEVAFWNAISGKAALTGFQPQVKIDGGRYRLDFGHELMRVGVELDGYEYHSSKDQFIKDRQRQRELEQMGWRIIRFAGSEVHADALGCANQLEKWIESL